MFGFPELAVVRVWPLKLDPAVLVRPGCRSVEEAVLSDQSREKIHVRLFSW